MQTISSSRRRYVGIPLAIAILGGVAVSSAAATKPDDVPATGATSAAGPTGPQGAGAAGSPSMILLSAIIPASNVGVSVSNGLSRFVVASAAVANEGDAIFVAPVDCALPKLRVVAQPGLSSTYTFTLLHYIGPENTAGQGNALVNCTIDRNDTNCTGFAELTIAADDGYSIRIDANGRAAKAGAIAVSLSCI